MMSDDDAGQVQLLEEKKRSGIVYISDTCSYKGVWSAASEGVCVSVCKV
jgi:hypothetical protein